MDEIRTRKGMPGIRVYVPADASVTVRGNPHTCARADCLMQALSMLIMSARRPQMSTMLVELYDALKEAGASEEKARAAALSLVIGHDRLERIEAHTRKIPRLEEGLIRIAEESDGLTIQIEPLLWMTATVLAGVLALIIKTFFG
jgi:preprotein translocase subunit Sec61beta